MYSIHDILTYLQTNWFEVTGMILSIVGVWLTAIEKTISWPVGLISCIIYGYIFYKTGLYADASLQVFFIVFGVYGWYLWSKGGNEDEVILISNTPVKELLLATLIGIPSALVLAFILKMPQINSTVPYFDSITTILSLIATWMAARKYIENWLIWIVTDIIYVPVYVIKGLYATAILYFIFTLLAVFGYYEWRKLQRKLAV